MPLLGLLGILFIGLKLAHVIAWSWWLVLLPIYIIPAFVVFMFLMAVGAAAVVAAND